MNFTNVSVFDAATMMEVGGEDEAGNTAGTGKDVAELTSQVEKSIAGNVRRVLELMYGQGKVAVSVKGTLNMQSSIPLRIRLTRMIKQDCWKKKKQQGRIQEVRLREMEAQQAQMLMQIHPVIRARQAHRQVQIHIPTTAQ